MRLLDVNTLEPKEFYGNRIPPYAILSHTWGDGEIALQELRLVCGSSSGLDSGNDSKKQVMQKLGYFKVQAVAELASKHSLKYVWVDTCCIDKTNNAELSEAINTMFKWYSNAAVCYAYLADVELSNLENSFSKSRWFQRGWTLQELIAPKAVVLYDKNWDLIGSRKELAAEIKKTTNIPADILQRHETSDGLGIAATREKASIKAGKMMRAVSVATRMSWASQRQTTRDEDIAYCLLGIFDVHMPLLYGEGGEKAFIRLQHQIVQSTPFDQSILAWGSDSLSSGPTLFSPSPLWFNDHLSLHPRCEDPREIKLSGAGLQVEVLLGCLVGDFNLRLPHHSCTWAERDGTYHLAVLDCGHDDDFSARPAIFVHRVTGESGTTYEKFVNGFVWLRKGEDFGPPVITSSQSTSYSISGKPAHLASCAQFFFVVFVLLNHILTRQVDELAHHTDFKKEIITLVSPTDFEESDIYQPPVCFDITLTGDYGAPWNLFSAVPEINHRTLHGNSTCRFNLPLRNMGQELRHFDSLVFSNTANPRSDFLVLWGFPKTTGYERWWGSYDCYGSWWGELALSSSVVPWAQLVSWTEGLGVSEAELRSDLPGKLLLFHNDLPFPNYCRVMDEAYDILTGGVENENGMRIGDLTVKVSTSSVDFLDRRSFQLSVEVTGSVTQAG